MKITKEFLKAFSEMEAGRAQRLHETWMSDNPKFITEQRKGNNEMPKLRTLYARIEGGSAGKAPQILIEDTENGEPIGYLDDGVLASPFGAKLIAAIEAIRKNGSADTKGLELKEKIDICMTERKVGYTDALRIVARENPGLWNRYFGK